MRAQAVGVALLAAALTASPARADLAAVHIEDVRHSGSGCPRGTLHAALSPDRSAFSLLFDDFTVQIGPGATTPRKRKCQVHVKMHVPRGWAYAVDAVDFRGFAFLDEGVRATQQSVVHIAGGDRTARVVMEWVGALWLDYLHQVVVDELDLAWSPCGGGRNLFIRTHIELDRDGAASDAQGAMAVDSADGRLEQTYGLRWRPCAE